MGFLPLNWEINLPLDLSKFGNHSTVWDLSLETIAKKYNWHELA